MERGELTELFERAFPFWNYVTNTDRETLINSAVDVTFEKGTNIHDGNECTGVILIKRGSLRLYMLSEEGKEVTLYRLFPGDICILSASCVLEMLTFDVYIDSEEERLGKIIPKSILLYKSKAIELLIEEYNAKLDGLDEDDTEYMLVVEKIVQFNLMRKGMAEKIQRNIL